MPLFVFLMLVCFVASQFSDATLSISLAISPLIGAALIGAGGSVLGNLFGSSSNKSANANNLQIARETNEANLQIARETNEANYKNVQENNAFQERMWNAQNAYNTPSAQAQRLKEAGLNPGLIMGQGNVGNAESFNATTPAQATTGNPMTTGAPQQGFTPDTSGITNAANMIGDYYANKDLRDANAAQARANARLTDEQARWYAAKTTQEIFESMAREGLTREQRRKFGLENGVFAHNLDAINQAYTLNNQLQESQIQNNIADITVKNLNAQLTKLNIKYLPEQMKAQIGVMVSEMALNGNLSYKAAQEAVESIRRAQGLGISNRQANKLVGFIVSEAKSNALIARREYDFGGYNSDGKDYVQFMNTVFKPFRGIFSGGFGVTKTFK